MSFQEKSAWVMVVGLLVCGLVYGLHVVSASAELGGLAPPDVASVITYTVLLIVISVVGHIVTSATAPEDAEAARDERETVIAARAGGFAGKCLAGGVIISLGMYFVHNDGNTLFYAVVACLALAQVTEYVSQLVLHRAWS